MDLLHLFAAIERFMRAQMEKKFTGKITITVNCNQGGIGNAQITSTFDIEKPKRIDNNGVLTKR